MERLEGIPLESLSEFKKMFNILGEGVLIVDTEMKVIFINEHLLSIAKKTSDEVYGKTCYQAIYGRTSPCPHCAVLQALESGAEVRSISQWNSNRYMDIELTAYPVVSEGKPVAAVQIIRDVTMHRDLEYVLCRSDEKYRSLIENASDGICLIDPEGTFAFFNPKFAEMFGYSEEDLIKKDFFELVHPEDLPRVTSIHWRMTHMNSLPKRYEYKGVTKDGKLRYLETNAVPVEVNGKVIGVQMIIRDVTQRQKAEKRMVLLYHLSRSLSSTLSFQEVLNKIVKFTSVLLDCFNCFILLLDERKRILKCVAASESVWDKAENLTINMDDVSLAAETVRIKSPIVVEEAHKSPIVNQKLREYFGHKSLLSVPLIVKDQVMGAIVLGETKRIRHFTEDEVELAATIASSAAVAIENARLYEEIWNTKDFLKNVIESSADSIITTDLEGRITSFSKGAEELFGFTAEEMIGKSVFGLYPKELRNDRAKWIERLFCGETLKNVKTIVRSSRGDLVHISVSLSLLKNADGDAIGTVEVARDITPEVKARESLKKAYKRLKELDELKDELIANVSHELRTPITIAKTAMELALRETNSKQRRKLLQLGISAMKRQNNIVGDLICIHEMQSKNYNISREPVDLVHLAHDVVEEMRPTARAKNVHLKVKAEDEIPRIEADFNEIKHALRNLVDNAIKFNRRGGAVMIELKRGWGCVKVSVKDTGIGIPPKYLERIFDRFYQIDSGPERQYGGTGMGLAIVKNIIEAHNGEIEVTSTRKKGSIFTFSLPI